MNMLESGLFGGDMIPNTSYDRLSVEALEQIGGGNCGDDYSQDPTARTPPYQEVPVAV